MNNKELMKLYENIQKNDKNENVENLNETPNYNNEYNLNKSKYNNLESINETPDVSNFNLNENLNDGWNNQFEIETRINGVKKDNRPFQQQKRNKRINKNENLNNDLNGLNQFLEEDKVQNIQKSNQINEKINTDNVDVVSIEMFESMRKKSMMPLVNKL